ncbi:MAG: hypothetical protein AVDCRST_MAG73-3177 [uncultured Thermomicrobiales bacterium]|uniref:CPBP family intramembrane metalloprotease n=1 Tax=uncultured Thermomicrobiales bacterium TaxID=1645740 RepID=A0A6J4UNZ7_9BACT|nr:MAG: hypothetical protein AVDCRST_MAG73-3177 [uncultured Thermomicrobiales bacterium]
MLDRARERPASDRAARVDRGFRERLVAFKRFYRWLNLSLVHHGLWPMLLLLGGAPDGSVAALDWPWFSVRVLGPLLAAVLALVYLGQWHGGAGFAAPRAAGALAEQARFALVALPVLLVAARLIGGPAPEVGRVLGFGLADVVAFHLIHFGVVAGAYADRWRGQAAAVGFFALAWAGRDAMLTVLGPDQGSVALAFLGGFVAGLAVALLARALRRWPGGWFPAVAAHWLVVYAVLGFVG